MALYSDTGSNELSNDYQENCTLNINICSWTTFQRKIWSKSINSVAGRPYQTSILTQFFYSHVYDVQRSSLESGSEFLREYFLMAFRMFLTYNLKNDNILAFQQDLSDLNDYGLTVLGMSAILTSKCSVNCDLGLRYGASTKDIPPKSGFSDPSSPLCPALTIEVL